MPFDNWAVYAGAIAGLIGAVAGIYGAVVAQLAHHRSKNLKVLDLRLELRKAENELRESLLALRDVLVSAKKSLDDVAQASKGFGGGRHKVALSALEKDRAMARSMNEILRDSTEDYRKLTAAALEDELIAVDAKKVNVQKLTQKYEAEIARNLSRAENLGSGVEAREGPNG